MRAKLILTICWLFIRYLIISLLDRLIYQYRENIKFLIYIKIHRMILKLIYIYLYVHVRIYMSDESDEVWLIEIWDLAWEENLVGRTDWHKEIYYRYFELSRANFVCYFRFNRYIYRDDNRKSYVQDIDCCAHESRIPLAYLWSASLLWQMFNEFSPSICPSHIFEKLFTILSNTIWHFNCLNKKKGLKALLLENSARIDITALTEYDIIASIFMQYNLHLPSHLLASIWI